MLGDDNIDYMHTDQQSLFHKIVHKCLPSDHSSCGYYYFGVQNDKVGAFKRMVHPHNKKSKYDEQTKLSWFWKCFVFKSCEIYGET